MTESSKTDALEDYLRASNDRFPMPQGEIARLKSRRWILSHVKPGGVGAEIGVFRGHFSSLICELAKPAKLYLVDPWTLSGPTFNWGADYTNFGTLPTETAKHEAAARCALFADIQVVQIEAFFPQGADQLAEPLDFAYLDASHRYEMTLAELRVLATLMAPQGVILGDDWSPDPTMKHHGVYLAVQDFVREAE